MKGFDFDACGGHIFWIPGSIPLALHGPGNARRDERISGAEERQRIRTRNPDNVLRAALRIPQLRASVSSGDQVGSDAKAGVGTGCSTRPVMSTM